ncbi:site-specific DNA-methyltransferase [Phocaeicola massiliensis]|jgi:hypothetical protein BACCOPRO_00653|uniref:site-specific DNA-methyltransferase n=1 Tax=Phocaeicola massiliensis TaxID=204516 RepID=UPI001897A84C|nr:site-specific DNA-methyltransferase [Phocaeicola massiliensis]
MNKKELYNKILQLDGLTNEEKSELLGLLRKQKKYGLVWEDKPEDVEERLRDELPVLIEDATKAIISDYTDAPNHVLIEGDNLEALAALTYTHEGKIDVIYIDPPYNTGNKDFVYNDSFVDSEDTYRHSKWLSFMNKRLRIAKQLLSDKGVIFISIDDNEQAQLKLLCDEIFSQNNFVSDVIWQHSIQPKGYAGKFSLHHNYTLIYRKSEKFILRNMERTEEDNKAYKNPDNDPRGKWRSGDVRNALYRPNLIYDIITPSGKIIHAPEKGWRWSKETVAEKINSGEIVFNRDETNIIRKIYLDTVEGRCPETIWFGKDVGTTREANTELKEVFDGEVPFDTPKPTGLLKRIMTIGADNNSTILDFFAGSGTTLHATMQLNDEDGGHRKCILVTNNENNICEEVTYERNKRVINGYTTPKGEEVPGLKGNTLRYYRTSFVGRSRSMKNMRQLMTLSTDMLCIKEDLYAEQPKFGEQQTYKNVFRYFDNGKKRMMIIYKEEAVPLLVDLIQKTDYEGMMRVYVFSPSEDPWEGEFEEVQDKVQLCALPQAIYNAYRRILPKKKDDLIASDDTETTHQEDILNGMLNFDEEEELQ